MVAIQQKALELMQLLQDEATDQQALNAAAQQFLDVLPHAVETDTIKAVDRFLPLLGSLSIDGASYLSLVIGTLVEKGYWFANVAAYFVAYYNELMESAAPLLRAYEERKNNLSDEESDSEELLEEVIAEREQVAPAETEALARLDALHRCAVSVFSADIKELEKAKNALKNVFAFKEISQGCFWLSMLLEIELKRPYLVIDLNTLKGITAEISGLTDNAQLQLLLMGVKELNHNSEISEAHLDVIKGYGPQQLDASVTGKWQMLNWQALQAGNNRADSKYWIWGEGKPADISNFGNYRVVLLDKPPYQRGIPVLRTFKNLKSDIEVISILSKNEIHDWLQKMQNRA